MRTIQLLLTAAFLLSGSTAAFANEKDKGHGACKTYWAGCKDSKGPAKFKCMKDAATAANDQACLDEMAKHKGGKHHGKKDEGGEKTSGASGD